MAIVASAVAVSAADNPFFHYKEWKTPHGTYPFNEICNAHYMPAFEEAMKHGLAEIDAICNNPAERASPAAMGPSTMPRGHGALAAEA